MAWDRVAIVSLKKKKQPSIRQALFYVQPKKGPQVNEYKRE